MIPPDQVLPCGCLMRCSVEDEIRVTTFIPCNDDCENYRFMLDEVRKLGKPVEYKEAP